MAVDFDYPAISGTSSADYPTAKKRNTLVGLEFEVLVDKLGEQARWHGLRLYVVEEFPIRRHDDYKITRGAVEGVKGRFKEVGAETEEF
jgi:hypothetical protein